MKDLEFYAMQTETKRLVTWGKSFGGHPTELRIVQYESWSEVFLRGGGYRDELETIMHNVPIDVLREIVRMHDELPPIAPSTPKRSTPR